MTVEIDVGGVLVPALLVWGVAGLAVNALLQRGLEHAGFYKHVWNRPLFDLALLVLVTGGLVAAAHWINP